MSTLSFPQSDLLPRRMTSHPQDPWSEIKLPAGPSIAALRFFVEERERALEDLQGRVRDLLCDCGNDLTQWSGKLSDLAFEIGRLEVSMLSLELSMELLED